MFEGRHPRSDARLPITGEEQCYARKQSSFWRIVHALFGAVPAAGYDARPESLARMALRDVLHECGGSGDPSITNEEVNDLGSSFQMRPPIGHVLFNGKKAASFELGDRP